MTDNIVIFNVEELVLRELFNRDLNCLKLMLENVPFEDAYMKLGGFNLTSESSIIGEKCVIDTFFDFNFGCLNGTIFRTREGMCEIHDTFDIWLDGIYCTPIARVCGDEIKWYAKIIHKKS